MRAIHLTIVLTVDDVGDDRFNRVVDALVEDLAGSREVSVVARATDRFVSLATVVDSTGPDDAIIAFLPDLRAALAGQPVTLVRTTASVCPDA